jgi:uncharacterized OsmC-like protein
LAISQALPLEALKVTARIHLVRRPPSLFRDLAFDVRLEGNIAAPAIEALARDASRHCFVENTLAKTMTVTTEVRLNGQRLLTLDRDPEREAAGSGPAQ